MSWRGSHCSSVFIVKFIVSVHKFISILFVVPKIFFGVYWNAGTEKNNLYMSTISKNSKQQKRVGLICSVYI